MKLLFIADPLESFKIYKDTTFAMMREAARRDHSLWTCEPRHISWRSGGRVMAQAREITLTGRSGVDVHDWYVANDPASVELAGFDAVVMRKDPPFDTEYFYATHLLEQAEREGARVFNRPAALRNHPEKLAILEFPQYITPFAAAATQRRSGSAWASRPRQIAAVIAARLRANAPNGARTRVAAPVRLMIFEIGT